MLTTSAVRIFDICVASVLGELDIPLSGLLAKQGVTHQRQRESAAAFARAPFPYPRPNHGTLFFTATTTLTCCTRAILHVVSLRHGLATGLFVIFCFCGLALAVSWASQPCPAKILRRFNGLWKERVALEVFGSFWLVGKPLRLRCLLIRRLFPSAVRIAACAVNAVAGSAAAVQHTLLHFSPAEYTRHFQTRLEWTLTQSGCRRSVRTRALPCQAWQLLRMLALWGIHKDSVARVASIGKTLCRVYLGVGLGFFQPMFLLTALLLAQHSLGCGSKWVSMTEVLCMSAGLQVGSLVSLYRHSLQFCPEMLPGKRPLYAAAGACSLQHRQLRCLRQRRLATWMPTQTPF